MIRIGRRSDLWPLTPLSGRKTRLTRHVPHLLERRTQGRLRRSFGSGCQWLAFEDLACVPGEVLARRSDRARPRRQRQPVQLIYRPPCWRRAVNVLDTSTRKFEAQPSRRRAGGIAAALAQGVRALAA
jgi:hypothetical protein